MKCVVKVDSHIGHLPTRGFGPHPGDECLAQVVSLWLPTTEPSVRQSGLWRGGLTQFRRISLLMSFFHTCICPEVCDNPF